MPATRRAEQRFLATVLFTDIVGSTPRAVELGDVKWSQLLERHLRRARAIATKYDGVEVTVTGDGLVTRFPTPDDALRAARETVAAARKQGLEIRAGVHAGELQARGTDLAGIAIHVAARVQGLARPGEVLTSSTVKDLVAGSTLRFVDRGLHALKGVPGEWRLFALADASRGSVAASAAPRSIMLVDDHPLWRQTLRNVLEMAGGGIVVAEAGDGEEAVELAVAARPSVVVMDMHMPTVDGVEATRRILAELPETHVIVLSSSDAEGDVLAAVRAGARGYLLKTAATTELVDALDRAQRGEMVFPPALMAHVLTALRDG